MEQPKEGGENKLPEAPKEVPVEIKTEEKKPEPQAGAEKKEEGKPGDDKVKELVEANNKALKNAENEIVRLKKELSKKEQGDDIPEDASDIRESIEALRGEIEQLKSSFVPKEEKDKTLEELAMARKKNEEFGRALVSKHTAGKGEGVGGNQDVSQPEAPTQAFAKTPQEIAILERRGIDPKTGKKK